MTIKAFSKVITLASDRTPPTEFRVIPFGTYETTKGDFVLTHEGAKRILSQLADEGVDVMIDWEHDAVARMAPGPTPAAGWCNIEMRPDGLWAVNVKWTPEATSMLSSAEYRYFSPAFTVHEDTGEILRFINIALTNRPATKKLEPLVAASRRVQLSTPRNPMKKKFLAALAKYMADNKMDHKSMTEKAGVDTEKMSADEAEPSQEEMGKVCKAMGVELSAMNHVDPEDTEVKDESDPDELAGGHGKPEKASDTADVPGEEKFEKLTKDFTDALVTLTGESNINKAKGVLAAMKEKAMAYDKDHEALVKLTKQRDEEKRAALVKRGQDNEQLTPSLIKLFSKKSVEELEAFLDHAPRISGGELHPPEAGSPASVLKKEDHEVAKLLNRDPESVAAFMQEEKAGKTDQAILNSYYEATRGKPAAAKK